MEDDVIVQIPRDTLKIWKKKLEEIAYPSVKYHKDPAEMKQEALDNCIENGDLILDQLNDYLED